jgi:hypothetical protein
MNGLTAANVDGLVDAIKKTHANCLALERREAARALADVLFVIHQLREENTIQTSRPDRVGDECWCFCWCSDQKRHVWLKAFLRAWFIEDNSVVAIVENAETKMPFVASKISFSTEAPE